MCVIDSVLVYLYICIFVFYVLTFRRCWCYWKCGNMKHKQVVQWLVKVFELS